MHISRVHELPVNIKMRHITTATITLLMITTDYNTDLVQLEAYFTKTAVHLIRTFMNCFASKNLISIFQYH